MYSVTPSISASEDLLEPVPPALRRRVDRHVRPQPAHEAEILTIAIDPRYRGQGLSRNLLLTHLGHLAARGVRTIFLEVEENNRPALSLYKRIGFAVVSRRERYYQEPGGEQLNALLMRRDLS